ncbi:MAG: riboflavin synthase [Candidatus Uhrbacteria bacterium]|nr:riboflavin synthase [Candidatus Uhrbacteria bacterium]
MFSGIIKSVGLITRVTRKEAGVEYEIAHHMKRSWRIGESVLVAGICSTILKKTAKTLVVFHMPETLSKTTSAEWKKGARVDIEPSLKVGEDISGHIVSGHVDGIARVKVITSEGDCRRIVFSLSKDFAKYFIPKGSVAVNGVSLTVVDAGKQSFSVALIPHTLTHTTLGALHVGDWVNIEVDMMAKYIEKYVVRLT